MATCVAASTTRMVVSSSCRVRKTRTLASTTTSTHQITMMSGSSSTRIRCSLLNNTTHGQRRISSVLSQYYPPSSFEATPSMTVLAAAVQRVQGQRSYGQLALSSAVLACALAFVTASTSSTNDAGSPSSSGSSAQFSRKGGGGGPSSKANGPVLASRQSAEEDVRKVEKEARKDPYTVSAGAVQGARWTMEDAYTVENGGRFVAVFDGHGGDEVSGMLRDRLYKLYCKVLAAKHWEERDDFEVAKTRIPSISSHVAALRGALENVEDDVLTHDELVYQGSTAVAVVLHVGGDGRRTLLSANVGDSRAILSRKGEAIDLTRDHKPNDERERARILALGEEIEWDSYGQLYRVRDLSLSRAIGDRFAKPAVSSEAEIKHFPVADGRDEFILLASDGLWDVMTSQEVVDYVHETLAANGAGLANSDDDSSARSGNPRNAMARIVANEALERGSADNVCVIVVWLKEDTVKN